MQVMRRRLSFDGGRQGENHLANPLARADQQPVDVEFRRTAPVDGAERAAENVIKAAIHRRPLHGPQIANILDNADGLPVTLRIAAQGADIAGIQIATIGAGSDAARHLPQILGKRQHQPVAILQQMQHRAPRRARPKPRKAGQTADQIVEL